MQNSVQTILIADNDDTIRLALSVSLAKEGYKVETAQSGTEVIQKIQNMSIDVLIMDVELSGMKGYEIVPILKKINPKLPIIMMSNDSSLELAKKVSDITGAEIRFYKNPRKERPSNTLRFDNKSFIKLGLKPIFLKDGLLREIIDIVAKYKNRCDLTKIICTSVWNKNCAVDYKGSNVVFKELV